MKYLAFTIWMIAWPLVCSIIGYLERTSGVKHKKEDSEFYGAFIAVPWFVIGFILFMVA